MSSIFLVHSEALNSSYAVAAEDKKQAIVEVLAFLHDAGYLEVLDKQEEDLDLKVAGLDNAVMYLGEYRG